MSAETVHAREPGEDDDLEHLSPEERAEAERRLAAMRAEIAEAEAERLRHWESQQPAKNGSDSKPVAAPFLFDIAKLTHAQLREAPPPRQHAIKPHLPLRCFAELAGAHGISKSTLALSMVAAIAAGFSWAGLPTTPGMVVFASREDPLDELLRRLQAWMDGMSQEDRVTCEDAFIKNLRLLGRDQVTGLRLTEKMFGHALLRRDAIESIIEACRGAVLIVLETASRLGGGDELNEDLSVLAESLEIIAAETGAAVLLVRHVAKSAARERTTDSYSGRGGGALSDAARSVMILTELDAESAATHGVTIRDGARAVMLTHAKASYSEPAAPLFFERRPGPVLEQIAGKAQNDIHDEWMLAYLADLDAPVSQRQIEKDCKRHGVPARRVKSTLERLAASSQACSEKVTGRGGRHVLWSTTATTATLI